MAGRAFRSRHTLARTLGWVSLGLAAVELAAPGQVRRLFGLRGGAQSDGILRVLGVRELMHGVDLLTHWDPRPGIWGRVAGDLLDAALLASAAASSRRPAGLAAIAVAVLPVVAADIFCAVPKRS